MTQNKLEIACKAENTQVTLEIRENEGKLRALIRETIDGKVQPVRFGALELVGAEGNQFFVLRAPLRRKDEAGQFLTRARQKDGKFLDDRGKEVDSEDKAAHEYVYMTQRNDESKLVYAQIGTLNVKNHKANQEKTAVTLISAKLYTDDEALAAERTSFKMTSVGKEHPDYAKLADELKAIRRDTGTWHNFFINAGADMLRAKGFEVRVRERATGSEQTPQP